MLMVLAMPLSGLGHAPSPLAWRAEPGLLALAAAQPEANVAVIVQKTAAAAPVEGVVAQLGGVVTKDLHIINAFAAEVPAGAVKKLAGAPGVRWVSLDGAMQAAGNPHRATTWAQKVGTIVPNGYSNVQAALSASGPDKVYASGGPVKGAFGGFLPEYNPGQRITRIESILWMYPNAALGKTENLKISAYLDGSLVTMVVVAGTTLNAAVGNPAGVQVEVSITAGRAWSIGEVRERLQVLVDQTSLATGHVVYLDAVGVRLTTGDGADPGTPLLSPLAVASGAINTSVLSNVFPAAIGATQAWNAAPSREGSGVGVAVLDSGVFGDKPFLNRLLGEVNLNGNEHNVNDGYGHGSFVAGLIADDGALSSNRYVGVAPRANVISVRVVDDAGCGTESDVVAGLQWINDNRAAYNIKVVNISLNASAYQSYHTSPLDAAVEILWFNGVVVVVSAGNNGTATLFPPANDPFVITVGAVNDMNTAALTDDAVSSFSAYGLDDNGQAKPDLVAPGQNIVAYLPEHNMLISQEHPDSRIDGNYFRMSGTSLAAPMVAGAAAILLEDEPGLNPDQVKYRLKATANRSWPGYDATKAGQGYLDVYAAMMGTTTQTANTGQPMSQLIYQGQPSPVWGSVNWTSVNWTSVNWTSVNWTSVNWTSVNWTSDYWGQ